MCISLASVLTVLLLNTFLLDYLPANFLQQNWIIKCNFGLFCQCIPTYLPIFDYHLLFWLSVLCFFSYVLIKSIIIVVYFQTFLFRTPDEMDCIEAHNLTINEFDLELLNVTRSIQFYDVFPTSLRLNSLYYKIYCIGCNSLFAWVIPLASLFYLNICTILGEWDTPGCISGHVTLLDIFFVALRKMKRQSVSEELHIAPVMKCERKVSVFHRDLTGKEKSSVKRRAR